MNKPASPTSPTSPVLRASDDAVREQLRARAAELGGELRAAEAIRADAFEQSSKDTVLDSGDQGEQRTREMVLSAEESRDADEISDIDAALKRLDDGDYGICIDCDMPIPAARLQVQPAAARCIPCQEIFEKQQSMQAPPDR